MMCVSILLLHTDEWESIESYVTERFGAPIARIRELLANVFGPQAPATAPTRQQEILGRLGGLSTNLVSILIAGCCFVQILNQNPIIPKAFRVVHRPTLVADVVDGLRLRQWWHMFAPQPFMHDTTIVVDGELADHTHVDPLTGKPPDFDNALHGPLDYGEPWYDYFHRLPMDGFKAYLPPFRDYLLRIHTVPGSKIHQPLQKVDVYNVTYQSPRPGGNTPYNIQKKLLISGLASDLAPPVPVKPAPSGEQSEPNEPASESPPAATSGSTPASTTASSDAGSIGAHDDSSDGAASQ
jgi:hypothetical protein